MDFNQKFEPVGHKIIHGAGQSPEMFSKYWESVGECKPAIYMAYIKIQNFDERIKLIKQAVIDYPEISLQIGFNFLVNDKDNTNEFANGTYDEKLIEFFSIIKDLNRPTFIRIGYEFDAPKKYNPNSFILAWKHFVELYRKLSADNTASVWCSCPFKGTEPFREYYPGNEFVDWFGVDLFTKDSFTNECVKDFMDYSLECKKPVMVGETTPARTGVNRGEESWKEWFVPFFNWMFSHKNVKCFCYINWDWGKDWKQPEWLNGRIHENEYVLTCYIKMLKDARFVHYKDLSDNIF